MPLSPPPTDAAPPVRLEVSERGDQLVLTVIGLADRSVAARFRLHVESGSNRSVQLGQARLTPGQAATLTTVAVNRPASGQWRATLEVEPEGAPAYTLEQGPPES